MTLPLVPPPRNHALTVIFKASNRCNARCTFCSVGKPGAKVISWEDFEHFASELEQLAARWSLQRLQFTFHGGEPTLLGPEFIDRACERIRRLQLRTEFSMQSNLLSITDELLEVIARHDVSLGTSLDPISGDRRDEAGRDAFPVWLRNYLKVAERIKAPGAIFVVTRRALGNAERLYEIALDIAEMTGQNFGLQINPVYAQGRAAANEAVLITPREFGEFLIDLWEAWKRAPDRVRLTPIQDFSCHFFPEQGGMPMLSCSFKGRCSLGHVGVDLDLNVAGCGRRLDSKAILGNLRSASLADILEQAEETRAIFRRAERLRRTECRDCRFFDLCNGGCPDDATVGGRDVMQRFHWCEAYRMLFEAMEKEAGTRRATPVSQHQEQRFSLVHLITDPEDAGKLDGVRGSTLWLLPTADGRGLRFDSGLASALRDGVRPARVWVHNRHVHSLAMWEDLLRKRRCRVVLFEAEGLEDALEALNELRFAIVLDMPGVLEAGGGEILARLTERFLFDQDWQSQVYPLTQIMLNVVNDLPPCDVDRWGLAPGEWKIEPSAAAANTPGYASELLGALRAHLQVPHEQWRDRRTPCWQCPHARICGGRFALGDGQPCAGELRAIVSRIEQVGSEVKQQLGTTPPG